MGQGKSSFEPSAAADPCVVEQRSVSNISILRVDIFFSSSSFPFPCLSSVSDSEVEEGGRSMPSCTKILMGLMGISYQCERRITGMTWCMSKIVRAL